MPILYKLSVPISLAAEEATVELLQELFHTTACVETDLKRNATHVSVFLEKKPSAAKLRAALPHFSIRRLRQENWAESWKRHFKPIGIASKLLIKPTWSKRKLRPGQVVVVLDPGLSFGTGQHPTTRFCLEEIVAFRRAGRRQSFLDIGTGSGILAIAAAKLGYAPVHAYDLDKAAVRIARDNARKNRVLQKIQFAWKDLAHERNNKKYDLVCANLLADVLLSQRDRLISRLKPSGRLVLAGILRLQFRNIQQVYHGAGLQLIGSA